MNPKHSTFAGILAVMLLVLYVLSAGPVLRFYVKPGRVQYGSPVPGDAERWDRFRTAYAPVYWLFDSTSLDTFNRYVDLELWWVRSEP